MKVFKKILNFSLKKALLMPTLNRMWVKLSSRRGFVHMQWWFSPLHIVRSPRILCTLILVLYTRTNNRTGFQRVPKMACSTLKRLHWSYGSTSPSCLHNAVSSGWNSNPLLRKLNEIQEKNTISGMYARLNVTSFLGCSGRWIEH